MTNSKCIAEELEGVCENILAGQEIHRHVHLIGGGRAKAAQIYPPKLVEAILRGLKRQMREDKVINAVEEAITGPSPDDYVEKEEEMREIEEQYIDDISGAPLCPKLVKAARAEEIQWLRDEKVYKRVPLSESEGHTLLKLKWLDVNPAQAERMYRLLQTTCHIGPPLDT